MARSQARTQDADRSPARAARTAVILNKNAKRVTERVRKRIVEVAPDADVFFTETLEQAKFVTRRVVDSGYGTVVTGGGDGTVVNTIQDVLDRVETTGRERPRFGVLRLGTGNAVADFLGARDYAADLQDFGAAATRDVHLLKVDGHQRTPFLGFGWDAYILNNYIRMKEAAERFAVTRALFKSAMGYVIAGVGKSVPELLVRRPRWQVRIINTGGIGFRLDADGQVVDRFAPGAVVYEGGARMVCAGTTPYYGFKFKIMPFADRTPGMCHVRVADLHPIAAVSRLPSAWRGTMRHPGMHDFQLSSFRLEFDEEAPFQIAGDGMGTRSAVDVAVDAPIRCCHFPG
ncbi:MAG: diacylglycerol kinase [Myxococcales bacterium]|nr:diacylglycerol kinase [Myxococcales bacterium]